MVLSSARADRLSDAALLAAIALGEPDACAVFVRRYQRQVYGLALTMCSDPTTSEDVAQQTFERVWRHAANFDGRRASVRTWVLMICRRLAIDAVRLRRSVPLPPEAIDPLLPPAADRLPEDRATDASAVVAVRHALGNLPDEQRRVVLLASLGGHTAVEIAEREGIPIGTAKSRLRLGLARLRTELAGSAVAEESEIDTRGRP
ncbi:MAG: RNA polymerase sigma factor [Acidimicrobiales bacterium]|jgi:RNA polymerase sigma-70 factor (ECF subfamily)